MVSAILPTLQTFGIGALCGALDFLYKSTAQKVCMAAGVVFEEAPDDDEPFTPSSERLDRNFRDIVITYPILEEVAFRGLLQPLLTHGLTAYFPQLAASAFLGLSTAALISTVAIGVGFGALHIPNYERGGLVVGSFAAISGTFLGIIKEKFGLLASIGAHMTSNLGTGLLDKYAPALLESPRERTHRLSKVEA